MLPATEGTEGHTPWDGDGGWRVGPPSATPRGRGDRFSLNFRSRILWRLTGCLVLVVARCGGRGCALSTGPPDHLPHRTRGQRGRTLTTSATCSTKIWWPNFILSITSPGTSGRRCRCPAMSCCRRRSGKTSSVQMYTAPGAARRVVSPPPPAASRHGGWSPLPPPCCQDATPRVCPSLSRVKPVGSSGPAGFWKRPACTRPRIPLRGSAGARFPDSQILLSRLLL